jgi:hypothetical protein
MSEFRIATMGELWGETALGQRSALKKITRNSRSSTLIFNFKKFLLITKSAFEFSTLTPRSRGARA